MRILVTGSSGRLGSAIVEQLAAKSYEVIGIDLVAGKRTSHLINMADRASLFSVTRDVEAVIHTASLHHPHLVSHSKQSFINTNITGTLNLLDAAVEAGVRRFVYTSTTSLYGSAMIPDKRAVWVTEELAPCPRDIYDISKIAAEGLCRIVALSAGMPTVCLRVARFFLETSELQAVYRLYRGVDLRDVVAAHILAVTNQNIPFATYNICARSPFLQEDLPMLLHNAPAVLQERVPYITEAFARRNWTLPASIDRVYVMEQAERHLGYTPAYGFDRYMRDLP